MPVWYTEYNVGCSNHYIAGRFRRCNGLLNNTHLFIMTPSLLSFLKAKELRTQALKNAQIAHLHAKKYRGVSYEQAPVSAPVEAQLAYRGVRYSK